MNKYILKNGKVILANSIISNGGIVIEDRRIKAIFKDDNYDLNAKEYEVIDVEGKYISPGFIDLHVHGGADCDFMDGSQDSIKNIVNMHALNGTTALYATTLTSSDTDLFNAFDSIREAMSNNYEGAKILGIHMEGPYFSYNQKGAQNPRYLKSPASDNFIEVLEKYGDILKRVSAAPELDGGLELGRELAKRKIVAAIAHSDATYDEILKAVDSGYSHVTHMYNGMSSVKSPDFYCQAGVVEAALGLDELTAEVIADGRHMPIGILKLLHKVKGADKLALVTDSCMAAGMPDGKYKLGGLDIMVEDHVAMLADRTSFAGSVATTNRLARVMIKDVGLSVLDTIKMLSLTPARIMGISDAKGSIAVGKDADVIVFDENLHIAIVIVEGEKFK